MTDSGTGDAGPSDGGVSDGSTVDDAGGPNGVTCLGAADGGCDPGQVCCSTGSGDTCQAASASCTGVALACDGTEDCTSGTCCGTSSGTACAASCTSYHICHVDAECGTGETCCPVGGAIPLGSLDHCVTSQRRQLPPASLTLSLVAR